jgi:cytochrome P450
VAVVFRELFKRLPDLEVTGPAVPLDTAGLPLVGGIKRLPVRFTPTARSNS